MTIENLRDIRAAYKEREQLREKIAELEGMRVSPRITQYGVERVQSTAKGDIQPDTIAKLDDAIKAYNDKLATCVNLIMAFENSLLKLDSRERYMLRCYYINGKTWEWISVDMGISWTRLHNIRRGAVSKIIAD